MILIDNYDSFTYNIVEYFRELGVSPRIYTNNAINIDELQKMDFDQIVLSPGPGDPLSAGICLNIIHQFHTNKKILGICLGHQCIAHYFGANIIQDKHPTHGKTSQIYFKENPLFKNIPQGFLATRYHSLIVDKQTINNDIDIIAETGDGLIMGIQHRHYPVFGLQFHPEAILTEYGKVLLKNFLEM